MAVYFMLFFQWVKWWGKRLINRKVNIDGLVDAGRSLQFPVKKIKIISLLLYMASLFIPRFSVHKLYNVRSLCSSVRNRSIIKHDIMVLKSHTV